jgi:hypothetical protein
VRVANGKPDVRTAKTTHLVQAVLSIETLRIAGRITNFHSDHSRKQRNRSTPHFLITSQDSDLPNMTMDVAETGVLGISSAG